MIVFFILSILILTFLLYILQFKIEPIFLALYYSLFSILGLLLIENNLIWKLNFIAVILLTLGYVLGRKYTIVYKKNNYNKITYEKEYKLNNKLIAVVIILIMYHFFIVGIPILSRNVEVSRFDFSGSGLFGIPGRMLNYGLPFICIYSSFYYFKKNNKKSFIFTIVIYLITKIFLGFKSGIIDVFFLYIYILSFNNKDLKIKKIFKLKYVLTLGTAVAFAVMMSKSYTSLDIKSNSEAIKYLFERQTKMQAEAGFYAIDNIDVLEEESYIINDFKYFTNKYFKVKLKNQVFPIDKIVSAKIYGTPLSENSFIVPVTIGGFNYLYLDFKGFALILYFLLGIVFGALVKKIKYNVNNPFIFAAIGTFIIIINDIISKGGIVYCLINYCAVIVFLWIIDILTNLKIKL